MSKNSISFIIMAAGNGSRMNSELPKVLHTINNIPMIVHILKTIINIPHDKIYIIFGKHIEKIKNTLIIYNLITYCDFVEQKHPNGTGDALKCCINELNNNNSKKIIVLNGDNPLIQENTLNSFINKSFNCHANIMTYMNNNPYGCGRIVIQNNKFYKIVEEKECYDNEKKIKLVNGGIYIFDRTILLNYLPKINNNNSTKEYYITDIFELLIRDNKVVNTYKLNDNSYELLGANTQSELKIIEKIYFEKILNK